MESVSLAVALSFDGVVAGFGAGLSNTYLIETILISFVFSVLIIMFGHRLGNQIAKKIPYDISWIGGLLLIVLAFIKLF